MPYGVCSQPECVQWEVNWDGRGRGKLHVHAGEEREQEGVREGGKKEKKGRVE